jgi:prefoldin subunit 5
MKIINIILSVLVLLLAAVSAVSSYFLYEKRSLLVGGWNEMAKSINETSTILDRESGTNVAKSLSPEKLGHENYSELDANLAKFASQVEKIQKQRNELGATIAKMSDILNINNAPSKSDLNKLSNYKSSSNDAIQGITGVKNRNDSTANSISRVADKMGVNISATALKSSTYSSELNKLSARADFINRRINTFNGSLKKIASSSGAGSIDLSDSTYLSSLTKTVNSVKKLKYDFESTSRKLRQKNSELATMNVSAGKAKQMIADKDTKIAELNKIIKAMQPKTDNGNEIMVKPWDDGSKEALAAVKGKIIDVNSKYGFVVVSLGTSTLVEQKYGKGFNRVNPKIQKNSDMVVARNLDSDNGKFIGKIKLVKINENCSIANVVPDSLNGRRISVGDSVYFSNETIAKLSK